MSDGVELVWPGKYDEHGVRPPLTLPEPAPHRHVWEHHGDGGHLVHGDNLAVLQALAAEGQKLDLVYLDPPFATGNSFSAARRIGGGDDPPEVRLPAYEDAWEDGLAGFLRMLDARLRWVHRCLADHGSLYVHVDAHVGHAVKLMLDDIFGRSSFQREIVWRIGWLSGFKTRAKNWIRNHDVIFFYVKDPKRFTFNKQYTPYPPGYVRRDGKPPTGVGIPLEDVWNANRGEQELTGRESLDSIQIKSFSREKTGWATQKNVSLLRRIIEASSNPGDWVADFFGGSGTTAVAAHQLGRRWITGDRSALAVQIARNRLLGEGAGFTLQGMAPIEAQLQGQLQATVTRGPDGAVVTLEGVENLEDPPELVAHAPAPLDRVEAWTVLDDAAQVLYEARRHGTARTLAERSSPLTHDGPLRVRCYDVGGAISEIRLAASR